MEIQFDDFIKLFTIQIIFGKYIQLFNLCVPEDFGSYFVLHARAFDWCQHAARLRHWRQLKVVLRLPEKCNSTESLGWARVDASIKVVLGLPGIGCANRCCMIKLSLKL